MRMYGLSGLHAYIIMTEDLDNLIARFVDKQYEKTQTKLLPIFLDNMQYPEEINAKEKPKPNKSESSQNESQEETSIAKLGTKCLKDMAARVNHITVRPLCESLLDYLDKRNLWVPNHFAIEALKSLSIGVLPQLYSTIIRFLLEHLDHQKSEDVDTKTSIVQCVQQILPNSITQQMPEVLSSMIRQISLPGENNVPLANAAVSCIANASEKQTDLIHQLDAMNEILSHLYSSGISNASKIALCQAVLQITEKLKRLSRDKNYPPSVIERLCVALLDKSSEVRQYLLICLIRLLKETDLLKRMKGTSKNSNSAFLQNQYENSLSQIHSSLLSQAKRSNNKPLHYRLIFEVHEQLLNQLQFQGVVALLPNLFHLQELKDSNMKNLVSIHALILILLSKVAQITNIPALSNYVAEIATQRKEANQTSTSLSVDLETSTLNVCSKKESKATRDISVDILFDKERIIDLLGQSIELSSSYDLPSLLDKDVSRSVTVAPGEMEAKIEERRKRKENAIGMSNAAIPQIPSISSPDWTIDSFESVFGE